MKFPPTAGFLLLLAAAVPVSASADSPADASIRIDNPEHARSLIDDHSSAPIEGIWEYPADEVSLLVVADRLRKGTFGVYVVEAVDCRLTPGMKVGEITRTADPRQYRLSLCSRLKKGFPGDPRDCAAKLSRDNSALIIESPGLRLSVSPYLIFPRLWNMLRISVRLKNTDPAGHLPDGWHKLYPSALPLAPITL